MRIQHNIAALNAHAKLGINQTAQSKNLEKLSSGYRINRAGDDAAGLAISEKMRGQIRGLNMANKNAQDGISLIQTAEGGLQETHDILQRMRELAVQSANGTYQDEVDRENINKEVNALKSEIDRISTSTHYNGINLLDGSLSKTGKLVEGTVLENLKAKNNSVDTVRATAGEFDVNKVGALKSGNGNYTVKNGDKVDYTIHYEDENGKEQQLTVSFKWDKNLNAKPDGTGAGGGLVAEDGTVYIGTPATGTAAGVAPTSAQFGAAILAEIKKNDEFSKLFETTKPTGKNDTELNFKAMKDGNTGAPKIIGIDFQVGGADRQVIAGVKKANTGTDAYKTLDTTKLKVYGKGKADGTKAPTGCVDKIEDAVFEINGKKFAFVNLDTDAADALRAQGIHTVNMAGNQPNAAAAQAMAEVIKQETGLNVDVDAAANTKLNIKNSDDAKVVKGENLTFQIGANGVKDQRVDLSVEDMSSKGIGIADISLHDRPSSNAAIDVIDKAINIVSGTRADLGALQNRLEHTTKNLTTTAENLQAAEARIRDVDMAREMMDFTKNNILSQAAQTMLAQANQQPQGVLQLLQ